MGFPSLTVDGAVLAAQAGFHFVANTSGLSCSGSSDPSLFALASSSQVLCEAALTKRSSTKAREGGIGAAGAATGLPVPLSTRLPLAFALVTPEPGGPVPLPLSIILPHGTPIFVAESIGRLLGSAALRAPFPMALSFGAGRAARPPRLAFDLAQLPCGRRSPMSSAVDLAVARLPSCAAAPGALPQAQADIDGNGQLGGPGLE